MTTETRTITLFRTKIQRLRLSVDLIPRRWLLDRLHARSSWTRTLAVFVWIAFLLLAGPLTAIHADGALARLAEAEGTEQPPPLRPEQVRFDHISTEDGLSGDRVWGITQDRRGFLWFTTYDGINRCDGYEFKVYKYDPEDPNSPASALYRRVLEDRRGMLWFGSVSQGLSRFDPETEQQTNFQHDPQDPASLSNDCVASIYQDRSGTCGLRPLAVDSISLSRMILKDLAPKQQASSMPPLSTTKAIPPMPTA